MDLFGARGLGGQEVCRTKGDRCRGGELLERPKRSAHRFDEINTLLWDYMGHAWKINYHTMRAAIQSEQRLSKLIAREA